MPKTVAVAQADHAVLCLLNKRRAAHGLGPLHGNSDLSAAAGNHSRYMDAHGCFDHVCAGEPDIVVRLTRARYLLQNLSRWAYGEDIAWGGGGLGTPKSIVQAWMHSPPHRENILSSTFDDAGVGVAWGTPTDPNGDGGLYTVDFGYRRK